MHEAHLRLKPAVVAPFLDLRQRRSRALSLHHSIVPSHVSKLSRPVQTVKHVGRGAAYREYSLDGLESAPGCRDIRRSLDAVRARPCGTLRPSGEQAVRGTVRARVTPRLVHVYKVRHLRKSVPSEPQTSSVPQLLSRATRISLSVSHPCLRKLDNSTVQQSLLEKSSVWRSPAPLHGRANGHGLQPGLHVSEATSARGGLLLETRRCAAPASQPCPAGPRASIASGTPGGQVPASAVRAGDRDGGASAGAAVIRCTAKQACCVLERQGLHSVHAYMTPRHAAHNTDFGPQTVAGIERDVSMHCSKPSRGLCLIMSKHSAMKPDVHLAILSAVRQKRCASGTIAGI